MIQKPSKWQDDILSHICYNVVIMLVRTTLRIEENLKKTAELKALQDGTTLQEIFNKALSSYLNNQARKEAKKIVFKTFHLGKDLDNLTRSDYYPDPK